MRSKGQAFQLGGNIFTAVLIDQNGAGGILTQGDLKALAGRANLCLKGDGVAVNADIFQQLAAAVGSDELTLVGAGTLANGNLGFALSAGGFHEVCVSTFEFHMVCLLDFFSNETQILLRDR